MSLTCDLFCVLVNDVLDLLLVVFDFLRNGLGVLEDLHHIFDFLLLVLQNLVLSLGEK